MKNLVVILAILISVASANAQFKVGANVGIPVGETSDFFSLSAGLDLYYMFGESKDALVKLGVTSSFINYFGDDLDGGVSVDDAQFIPIGVAGRITVLSTLTAGVDVGYGIGINIEDDGGPYGRLVAGIDLGNVIELNAFYHLVKVVKGSDFASAGLGLLVEF